VHPVDVEERRLAVELVVGRRVRSSLVERVEVVDVVERTRDGETPLTAELAVDVGGDVRVVTDREIAECTV
jgi:hypothetical protein